MVQRTDNPNHALKVLNVGAGIKMPFNDVERWALQEFDKDEQQE